MQMIGDIEVEVVPRTTLNTTKGVVVRKDLLNSTEEEIETEHDSTRSHRMSTTNGAKEWTDAPI